jgi:uncharacterized sporulation protein YeaH/YhbH (DUF444 family)
LLLSFTFSAVSARSAAPSDRSLQDRKRQQRKPKAARIWKEREDRTAEQAIAERARITPLDLRARRLDERRVLHAGRT